jgi:hypothetical protein
MLNVHTITIQDGNYYSLKTLEYMYPQSRIKLEYKIGGGSRVEHYIYVWYNDEGMRVYKSKNDLAKPVIEFLNRTYRIQKA